MKDIHERADDLTWRRVREGVEARESDGDDPSEAETRRVVDMRQESKPNI